MDNIFYFTLQLLPTAIEHTAFRGDRTEVFPSPIKLKKYEITEQKKQYFFAAWLSSMTIFYSSCEYNCELMNFIQITSPCEPGLVKKNLTEF